MLNSSVRADMMGSMMSRLQLSAIETGDVTEQEFRDNRSLFQRTGNWACPVCMFQIIRTLAANVLCAQVQIHTYYRWVPPTAR